MDDWKPIESAPTDGHRILLCNCNRDDGLAVGYWDMYYSHMGNGYTGGDGWVIDASGEEYYIVAGKPTHWMALPPLPPQVGGEHG
jgi:hypothetical protein